ncbi:uncharacterized protein LOC110827886 isoform X2 [Zootermopsis nevadensis]|uniref:uncharacterized protein LOC110827886 isoform X2 n=1 Tax=Zootermopsis nevadensis TaxID=136037 RepID=UPI000B8E6218|nr:uncharacterized protein LOC110827886 isoform X2 [Zootermopsis nevadensis]
MMSLYRTIKGTGTQKRSRDRSGPAPHSEMVSRRKILSRSRDDLNLDSAFVMQEEEEDVWYQRDKLYKDHIQEVLDKWTQIDDEIWAKVIVLERNRRVAKAYARAPVLTVNGSDDGFDGFRIGLCGFDNPMRDPKTDEIKRHIGHGVKVKMDDQGNILVKRVSKCNVFVKCTSAGDETSVGNDVLKLPNCALEMEKPVKLFDMKKFQQNVHRELRRAYPDRRRLECQCLSAVAFVKSEPELLDCPIWVLIINVVAMDMLKSKLPPVKRAIDIRNRPRIPIPDEDPYSVAGSGGSSGSSGVGTTNGTGNGNGMVAATREQLLQQQQHLLQRRSDKPPKLPPRDNNYPHDIPKPDYDDIEEENRLKPFPSSRGRDKAKDSKKYDDPYYCGLRARVPNFVKSTKSKDTAGRYPPSSAISQPSSMMHHLHQYHQQHHPVMWHARSIDSGMGRYSNQESPECEDDDVKIRRSLRSAVLQRNLSENDAEALESPYNHIYGRLPIPTRGYIPPTPRTMYVGEWD